MTEDMRSRFSGQQGRLFERERSVGNPKTDGVVEFLTQMLLKLYLVSLIRIFDRFGIVRCREIQEVEKWENSENVSYATRTDHADSPDLRTAPS